MQPGVAAIKNIPVASQFYWPAPIGTPLYVTGLSEWLAGRGERVIGLIDDPDKRAEIGAQGGAHVEVKVARNAVLKQYAELMTGRSATCR